MMAASSSAISAGDSLPVIVVSIGGLLLDRHGGGARVATAPATSHRQERQCRPQARASPAWLGVLPSGVWRPLPAERFGPLVPTGLTRAERRAAIRGGAADPALNRLALSTPWTL